MRIFYCISVPSVILDMVFGQRRRASFARKLGSTNESYCKVHTTAARLPKSITQKAASGASGAQKSTSQHLYHDINNTSSCSLCG